MYIRSYIEGTKCYLEIIVAILLQYTVALKTQLKRTLLQREIFAFSEGNKHFNRAAALSKWILPLNEDLG